MQRHVLLKLAAWATCASFVAGCGDAGGLPATDVGSDTVLQDTSDPSRPPAFELGTNVQGRNDAASFQPLMDGDELEIVFGPQGLWMVVLSFRTRGLLEGPLFLEATIRVDDVVQGSLALQNQTAFAGPQGFFYYFNFFLVVSDPTVSGRDATIAFLATDDDGRRVERTVTARLTGGL